MTAAQANRMGAQGVAQQSTVLLVQTFELTNDLLDPGVMPAPDYMTVCVTRGWIIDELVRRGEAHMIGLSNGR